MRWQRENPMPKRRRGRLLHYRSAAWPEQEP